MATERPGGEPEPMYARPEDYDFLYLNHAADIPLITQLAQQHDGNSPILEMACGTLRVSIPLARQGVRVHGVDISEGMIQHGVTKLSQEKYPVRQRVSVFQGDMRDFQAPNKGRYQFCVVPFTAFQHLTTTEDQTQALGNIHDHLAESGLFVADLINPKTDDLNWPLSYSFSVLDSAKGEILDRNFGSVYDEETNTAVWTEVFTVRNANTNEIKRRYSTQATMGIIFPDRWRELLTDTGFKIVSEWGGYKGEPFDPEVSHKILFLCQKT